MPLPTSTKRKEIVNGLCASEQALWSQQMAWQTALAGSHVSSSDCSPFRNRSCPHLFLPGHCQIKRGMQTGREENFILCYKIRKQMQRCNAASLQASTKPSVPVGSGGSLLLNRELSTAGAPAGWEQPLLTPGPPRPQLCPGTPLRGQAAIGARGLLEACVSQSSSRTALGDSNTSMLGGSHSMGTVRPVAPQLPRQT